MGCAASTAARIADSQEPMEEAKEARPTALWVGRTKIEAAAAEKVVLLGDSGVGKSSILQSLSTVEGFDPRRTSPPQTTMVTAFLQKTMEVPAMGCSVKLEIWDTAGQERFSAMAPLYYHGASAAIIVYDITSICSFDRARFWVAELMRCGSPQLLLALVGNKGDLHSKRRIYPSAALALASSHAIPLVFETSALTSVNIYELFHELCRHLIISRNNRHIVPPEY